MILLAMIGALSGPVAIASEDTWQVPLIREQLDRDLRDWPTARFRNVIAVKWEHAPDDLGFYICGSINATNSAGGYTGWRDVAGGVRWSREASADVPLTILYGDPDIVGRDATADETTRLTAELACAAALAATGTGLDLDISEDLTR
ncbi:MAG TPA: hypothetical protein DIV82_00515 [Brevundimonas diminuta]|nr:hypothetical protein [Brevundimonas diminuta]